MTHRGPFQPPPFCGSVKVWKRMQLEVYHTGEAAKKGLCGRSVMRFSHIKLWAGDATSPLALIRPVCLPGHSASGCF